MYERFYSNFSNFDTSQINVNIGSMKYERTQSSLETTEAVMAAAKLAGINTADRTMNEIKKDVVEAGQQIISTHEKPLPKNYRRIHTPPTITPLASSVVAIIIENLDR
jgi:hypothetical protein